MKKAIIILMCALVGCFFLQRTQYKKISTLTKQVDSLRKQNDSLYSEVSAKDIQVQRYEYIFDRAQEEFSDECREKLEEIMSQTE